MSELSNLQMCLMYDTENPFTLTKFMNDLSEIIYMPIVSGIFDKHNKYNSYCYFSVVSVSTGKEYMVKVCALPSSLDQITVGIGGI